jgi:phospholipid transport system substrate-binding protein
MDLRPLVLCLLLGLSAPVARAVEDSLPAEKVASPPETILQNGLRTLTEHLKRGGGQREALAVLDQDIARYFDFGYMARLSAGAYWGTLGEERQRAFEERFRHTFFQALARQISNLGEPRVQFYPTRPGTAPNEMTVSARVTQSQGIPILMDFRFYRSAEGWKVFDVAANGSSAVLYYRSFYADIAQRYGIDALLNCC